MILLRLLGEILREIFDESAYGRFCFRTGSSPDRHSYAKFQREASTAKSTKVKCC
jgi:hypothetical protein